MSMICDDFDPINSFRSPAWRLGAAVHLLASGRPPRASRLEPGVAEAIRYLQAKAFSLRRARAISPALAQAEAVWTRHGPRAWQLEARLIAGEPVEQIAAKVDLPAAAIHAYERTYFDMTIGGHVIDRIAGGAAAQSRGDDAGLDESLTWRWLGWTGGPVLIDLMVADYLKRPSPAWPDRAELATKGRLVTRLHWTPIGDKRASAQLLKDLREHRPEWIRTLRRKDPMMYGQVQFLRLAAGELRRRKRRSDAEKSETTTEPTTHAGRSVAPATPEAVARARFRRMAHGVDHVHALGADLMRSRVEQCCDASPGRGHEDVNAFLETFFTSSTAVSVGGALAGV
ncbi:hypothetical protein ACERK3_11530 [Phycisphaerales bacterium AB-hyl4]|uniref:Uncharacterized protein n=1 Tax=Natronomicrosphaera hydrolytica TaxID=3242702 RepID=A0ABV4U5P2_9BACT